jgi:O-Antigen ligase
MNPVIDVPARLVVAASLLVVALALSLVFYGTAINLLILAMADAALLCALAFVGPRGIVDAFSATRGAMIWSVAALFYLVLAYRLSLSPDNSFAPSWVLAAGPMAFIGAASVRRDARVSRALTLAVVSVVTLLATNSCVRFLLYGERAHEPLNDSNGYASLIYLVWIPLVHFYLVRCWRGEPGSRLWQPLVIGASFVMLLALLATRSRTSALIVAVAVVLWMILVVVRRLSWRPLLIQLCVAAGAVAVSIVCSTTSASVERGLEFGGGLMVRIELIRAALAMLVQYPLGVGVFGFPLLYPSFRSTSEQDTAGLFVHNDYVQFLVEGGPPLLLLLLVFVFAVLRRVIVLARLSPSDSQYPKLGIAIALVAASAHAIVNFVFYSLPLGILIGLMSAYLFVSDTAVAEVQRSTGSREVRLAAGALVFGWVMWLYLLLDVAIVGVFQGQPSLPFAASIRADEQRMLRFARVAERLNGNRGIPALGEAVLLYRALRAEPGSAYLKGQTYQALQHALAVDPWNSLIYLRLAQFLDEFPPPGGRRSGESDEELLTAAIGLDPLFLPGIDRLLELYAARGDDERRYALLRNVVYPWMPTVRRRDPTASDRYFGLLEGYADAAGDRAFAAEVRQKRSELARFVPAHRTRWFF